MNKQEFLNEATIVQFCSWLGKIISGDEELGFKHQQGIDLRLHNARARYCWPPKSVEISSPVRSFALRRNSTLAENAEILDAIGAGLRKSLESPSQDSQELFEWLQAVLVWGGVYTRRGNAGWLRGLHRKAALGQYWSRVLDVLHQAEDDDVGSKLEDLRSNAGTTKVHSLVLPEWVIYDSRVAAALAWLVHRWSDGDSPSLLHFACMRPNTRKPKSRSPDETVFEYFSPSGDIRKHRAHLKWNVRANWVLSHALANARMGSRGQDPSTFLSLREVEAALFMIGDDLSLALPRD
ncbi:hypothetical protein [Bradyrhizobium betae]|uniref:Uncharacterized protein n=1 Tax=Bradyrhizobium betae TaxID=244734 RepID=A0A5P6P6Q0_9BRAD|nr:hypothetical protein [Bradyrhizobium betae]MCS3731365.1 hypothetical protein [Bradyrhizobium betae]QFI73960.1 hypothetical protein F8237_17015 [Bradyrhizobium betae]